jgi:hypothetical protein
VTHRDVSPKQHQKPNRRIVMAGKIFCRERTKVGEGKRQPMYRVVAVAGTELKFNGPHFRRSELEQIAEAAGAEVVYLSQERGEGKHKAEKG